MKCDLSAYHPDLSAYHPTIWRTCRVLANFNRLACLRMIVEQSPLTVGEIAERLRIPINQASMFLRALQARGLIRAQRKSRWVYYAPFPDPLVSCARPLLDALRHTLVVEKRSAKGIIHTLTAFTHPRRLTLLFYLQTTHVVCSCETLVSATGISLPAMKRHLRKLAARRLIHCRPDRKWQLTSPPDGLSQTLLHLIDEEHRKSV